KAVLDLAQFPGLYIKFATINLERLEHAGVAPAIALSRLLDAYGSGRIMWGSDMPNTPGEYTDMVAWMLRAIDDLSGEDRAAIMGGTARTVYRGLAVGSQ